MKMRASIAGLVLATVVAGCGHGPGGKVPADTMQYNVKTKAWEPLLPYKAPDVDEITGIDSSEPDEAAEAPAPAQK
jgi:hypothetical protein